MKYACQLATGKKYPDDYHRDLRITLRSTSILKRPLDHSRPIYKSSSHFPAFLTYQPSNQSADPRESQGQIFSPGEPQNCGRSAGESLRTKDPSQKWQPCLFLSTKPVLSATFHTQTWAR